MKDERAEFEKWALDRKLDMTRRGDGYYGSGTHNAWVGWQARASLAETAGAATPKRLMVPRGGGEVHESCAECVGVCDPVSLSQDAQKAAHDSMCRCAECTAKLTAWYAQKESSSP